MHWKSVLFVSALAGVAWLFTTKAGAQVRRQLDSEMQHWRRQSAATVEQMSQQAFDQAQDVLDTGRQMTSKLTKQLAG